MFNEQQHQEFLDETHSIYALPKSLTSFLNLYFRPSKFFSNQAGLLNFFLLFLAAWSVGQADIMDRIDTNMLKAELGQVKGAWLKIIPAITSSWLMYWGMVLVGGVVNGLVFLLIGSWWYKVRLKWCDAVDVNKTLVSASYLYSSLVYTIPCIIWTIAETLVYNNYGEAYAADESYSLVLIIFLFWAIFTSYYGVRTLFDTNTGKARFWFLIMPTIFYLFIFGAVAIIFSYFG